MKNILFFSCLFLTICLLAQKQECYVINAMGQRQKAMAVKADSQGNLTVQIDDRLKVPYKAGSYKFAFIPKPKEINELEKLLSEEEYEELITASATVFDAYKYLGWADAIAALQYEAFLATGKPEKAHDVYQLALKFPHDNNLKIQRMHLMELVTQQQYDIIEQEAKKLILSKDDSLAAFAFNLRGLAYEAKGQKKEAVVEYLKTVLLFDGKGKTKRERDKARLKAIALMKELKDPRVTYIETIK